MEIPRLRPEVKRSAYFRASLGMTRDNTIRYLFHSPEQLLCPPTFPKSWCR